MYLMVTARKGVSSVQLAKEIGVTQKSAWFMLQRLRESCRNPNDPLSGIVEIDEAYFGGSETNKHDSKKLKGGRGPVGKTAVLGMRERKGRVIATPLPSTDHGTMQRTIRKNVELFSVAHTDDHRSYIGIDAFMTRHHTVNHTKNEYVRGNVHTNSIESVWAVMKRGVYGVYHQVSKKHMSRYLNEFTFRLNQGACANHTLDRIDAMFTGSLNKRLTYKSLVK